MKFLVYGLGWVAFIAGVIFTMDALLTPTNNIIQQIFVSVGALKAILCFILFVVSMSYTEAREMRG